MPLHPKTGYNSALGIITENKIPCQLLFLEGKQKKFLHPTISCGCIEKCHKSPDFLYRCVGAKNIAREVFFWYTQRDAFFCKRGFHP
ncbi:hypothetical protein BACCAP_00407 [Pseudoflavonifractor capillosus ATCC 29799]|uniref:Uncharacterized protein n=1 Tax=Pseudoflavonifractor capillosus ATCC 29799 TaxID=411467 RepID=A6NQD7_9FIRM|nr:hypothetical protein BACCAP_00407 [Pseudoflavonifractor capillosus ATCC 29799]